MDLFSTLFQYFSFDKIIFNEVETEKNPWHMFYDVNILRTFESVFFCIQFDLQSSANRGFTSIFIILNVTQYRIC